MILSQPPAGEHRLLLIHHHSRPDVVGSQLRHFHAETVAPSSYLRPVAIGAEQLQVADLVPTIVTECHNVVCLEPQVMGLAVKGEEKGLLRKSPD